MTLSEKQQIFTANVANLITWAYSNGFSLSFGEAYRTPEQAALNAKHGTGIVNSLHILRLAVDLNLFKDGQFMFASTDHKPLGDYWKTLHADNRWGGDFLKSDGNHYSMTHEGRS